MQRSRSHCLKAERDTWIKEIGTRITIFTEQRLQLSGAFLYGRLESPAREHRSPLPLEHHRTKAPDSSLVLREGRPEGRADQTGFSSP